MVAPRPLGGNSDDWYDGRPIGLGPRVPMTVVSPWTIGGNVCSEVFDHTSVVQLLEKVTGVEEPNISAWRRAACGDLTSAFDFETQGTPPTIARPGPVPAPVSRWHPDPPDTQQLPSQEQGRKPARAVPYRVAASAGFADPGQLRIRLSDDAATGAPFAIYGYAGELVAPKHVFVAPGTTDTTTLTVPTARWDVAVQGPNRFWYELAGSATGDASHVDVRTLTGLRRGSLLLELVTKATTR